MPSMWPPLANHTYATFDIIVQFHCKIQLFFSTRKTMWIYWNECTRIYYYMLHFQSQSVCKSTLNPNIQSVCWPIFIPFQCLFGFFLIKFCVRRLVDFHFFLDWLNWWYMKTEWHIKREKICVNILRANRCRWTNPTEMILFSFFAWICKQIWIQKTTANMIFNLSQSKYHQYPPIQYFGDNMDEMNFRFNYQFDCGY